MVFTASPHKGSGFFSPLLYVQPESIRNFIRKIWQENSQEWGEKEHLILGWKLLPDWRFFTLFSYTNRVSVSRCWLWGCRAASVSSLLYNNKDDTTLWQCPVWVLAVTSPGYHPFCHSWAFTSNSLPTLLWRESSWGGHPRSQPRSFHNTGIVYKNIIILNFPSY